jgi:hypothetical protein
MINLKCVLQIYDGISYGRRMHQLIIFRVIPRWSRLEVYTVLVILTYFL